MTNCKNCLHKLGYHGYEMDAGSYEFSHLKCGVNDCFCETVPDNDLLFQWHNDILELNREYNRLRYKHDKL